MKIEQIVSESHLNEFAPGGNSASSYYAVTDNFVNEFAQQKEEELQDLIAAGWTKQDLAQAGTLEGQAEDIAHFEQVRDGFLKGLKPGFDAYLRSDTQMKDQLGEYWLDNDLPLNQDWESVYSEPWGNDGLDEALNEFSFGNDDDDGRVPDPYGQPQPQHYNRSVDFFGQFEANWFDKEDMNDATGEFKGYWNNSDGKPTQIAYFKFDNPGRTGSNHPGMGWYYEPELDENLNEFAPASNPGGGNYLKALASAWYNGTFNTGDLHKGIKSQEDVERILERGIHCGDGKVRKYSIGYNADFDGVEIQSDDHYEYSDYDDAGNDIDSRTGKPWGPYDVVAFADNELDESVAEGEVVAFPKKHKGDLEDTHDCPKCGGDLQGGTYMGHKVKVCIPCKQVYLPPNSGIDQQGNKIKEGYSDMMAKERKKRLAAAEKKKQERLAKEKENKKNKEQGVAEGLNFNDKKGKWEWDDGTYVDPDELTTAQKQRIQQWKADNPGKRPSRASVPDTREPARGFGGRVFEAEQERKRNALWAQITSYEKRAKETKNDIKKQHLLKMADELRGKLAPTTEEHLAESLTQLATLIKESK